MTAIANSSTKIQAEGFESTRPVSESGFFAIGGGVNYCLTNSAKVGDVVQSLLSLSAFQALRDTTWVLMDGLTSIAGSELATLTGLSTLPDARGTFPRMTGGNLNGRDPNGAQAVGNYVGDQFASHDHTFTIGSVASAGSDIGAFFGGNPVTTSSSGGSETAPKAMYMNWFIKINT